ncbi:MAG: glycosyltransferase [Rectinemataceae bacterium]|nr:glycosyltransferase [Rectinemataceae bacterium]
MKSKSVLFFSSDDWASGLKTSKYHMARCLADDGYTVIYVNSIGLRMPTLSVRTASRIVSRLRSVFRGVTKVQDNIFVFTPIIVPFHNYRIITWLNRLLLVASIRILRWRMKLRDPELWVFLPNHAKLVGALGECVALYYCVDEHTLFDGVDSTAMRALEDDLIKKVDLVVATARSLYETKGRQANRIIYLPHGVEVAHFRKALDDATAIPEDLRLLPHPVVGFFGLIEKWIDLDMIAAAARKHPEWSFVLLGKVVVDIRRFRDVKNMHFLGAKPFTTLPSYCKAFDCGILPFKITRMTVHVNPLKMREYLAAGLPVVSSDLPEVRAYTPTVRIARDSTEFCAQIEDVVKSKVDRVGISQLMDNEGWETRYRSLRLEIDKIIAVNSPER